MRYRDYGWGIFQSIEKYCRVDTGGYASIINVDEVPVRQEDKMETFLMVGFHCYPLTLGLMILRLAEQSETLKYLYLLFADASILPLDGTYPILVD
jgi:hypothetical protein